jgi:NADH:ubiquinone oxidoreductase subunit E
MSYRKFIFVCTGADCKENGAKVLCKEIKEALQNESNKGKYKIIKTKCMDFCKSGPIVVMNNELIKSAEIEKIQIRL